MIIILIECCSLEEKKKLIWILAVFWPAGAQQIIRSIVSSTSSLSSCCLSLNDCLSNPCMNNGIYGPDPSALQDTSAVIVTVHEFMMPIVIFLLINVPLVHVK